MLIYAIRSLLRIFSNIRRRLCKAPDYVVFTLEGSYPDIPSLREPFWKRFLQPKKMSLLELGEQLETVARDRRVRGVILHLHRIEMSFAQLERVRGFLLALRKEGKRVVVWSSLYDTACYYLACAADEILLQPVGSISSLGLASSYLFLADALERVGLKADFVQISPYKTAADTLGRNTMSQEAREMADWLLDDIYSDLIRTIAQGRKIDEAEAERLIDNSPYTDAQVLDAQAIDSIIEEEDLSRHLGIDGRPARLLPYDRARARLLRPPLTRPGRYVAIIRVEGMIIDGKSSRPPGKSPFKVPFLFSDRAGDLTVVAQVRQAAREKRVAAVVLHVDSGGGSATASEAMSSALRRLAAQKPLVVSMSSVAASGGYYVATPAAWIVAQGSTITGSIGVLSGKLVNAGMFDRLMFNRELISRGAHAAISHPGRPYSKEEKKIVWDGISRMYDVFLDRVATGRKLAREEVDAIGGGRVWTGRQALKHGLVDELGGLETAADKARELAGISPRVPLREIRMQKGEISPLSPLKAGLINYAITGVNYLQEERLWLLSPLVID